MKFINLVKKLNRVKLSGKANPEVKGLCENSKKIRPGDLFVCIPGSKLDGREFAREAIRAGACALVAEGKPLEKISVPQAVVPNSREALARLAHAFFDEPSKRVKVIGVTGTKGKTTTTYLLRSILQAAGKKTGLIGTISYQIESKIYEASNTTPSALSIVELLDEMRREGCSYAVMEVSSHALEMKRVMGVEFQGATFTNLGRDHLDYHKNFKNYFMAKRRLFTEFKTLKARTVNADDAYGKKLLSELKSKAKGFGLKTKCAYQATHIETAPGRGKFRVMGKKFEIPLSGKFNIYNSLAALSVLREMGFTWPALQEGLRKAPPVPGRFEEIYAGQDFTIIVDYAHTPDSLRQVLIEARNLIGNKKDLRLISLFGCGGDRDRTKRPLMGQISACLADVTVVTSDNPRTEEPKAIIDEILKGIAVGQRRNGHRRVWSEVDRKDAIHTALSMAKKGDIVLIAGKGHETYQVIGDQKQHFDDRETVRNILKEMKGS